MSNNSHIEWTEATWNPLTGCDKISPGCKNCYAERMSVRLKAMGVPRYANGFNLSLHEDVLEAPLGWKKPRIVFVNSMSDLFHKDVPTNFVQMVFSIMRRAHWHQFQVLTKRAERLLELNPQIDWPDNVWMGVSVESSSYENRIDLLRKTGAKIKFLSVEPLLGPIPEMNLNGIDWVIIGGESGPGARIMNPDWVIDIREQCKKSGVAFFFKQWGGVAKRKAGRVLQGRTWNEMPKVSQSKYLFEFAAL